MPSELDLEYARLAANAYSQSEAVVSAENTIPVASGWTRFAEKANPNGFLARAYRNAAGEIAIAYGGTTFEGKSISKLRDFFTGNIAGTGLVLAPQVVDAAKFYLDLRATNPTAPIRLTGHSLGGGLASLMAVFFNEQATVFDEAPFRKSADSSRIVSRLKDALVSQGYSIPSALANYSALDPTGIFPSSTRQARQNNVSSVFLQGEALSLLQTPAGRAGLVAAGALINWVAVLAAVNVAPIAPSGQTQVVDPMAKTGNGWGWVPPIQGQPIDLHSMSLLIAFMQSPQLVATSQGRPELLQKLFTSGLTFDRETANRNIIDLFVQRQFAGQGAWDVVAGDTQRITGALTTDRLAAALVAIDLAMHYGQGIDRALGIASGPFEHMFRELVGGIQLALKLEHEPFTRRAHSELTDALSALHPDLDRFIIRSERYSLQSSGNLVASATTDAKFDLMLGGTEADQLTSGDGWDRLLGRDGADTLVAGTGNDTLVGGAGDDVLNGGAGLDYYYRRAGDGNDTIIEEREGGILGGRIFLVSDAADTPVAGVFLQQGTAEVWTSHQGGMTLTHGATWTLTLADGSTLDLGADLQNGDFGIYRSNSAQSMTFDRTIVGDLEPRDFNPSEPGVQTQTDDLGNVITTGNPQPGRIDTLFDSAGNDDIRAFAGDDLIEAFRGGNDRLDGGAGRDAVGGRAGDDVVIGGTEGDLLRGDGGKDKVYGDSEVTVETALAALDAAPTGARGDFMDGGTEDDTMIAGADNDALNGGAGADLIITGAGDDDVDADLETSIVSKDWSVTREIIDQDGVTIYNRVYNGVGFLSTTPGGDDVVFGGGGADWLFTREGNDWIHGGAGDDVVFGEAGSDEAFGGSGNDRLFGDSASVPFEQHGDDLLDGEDGDDIMNGDGGDDILFGGEGADEMFGDSTAIGGMDYLDGEAGNDTILGVGNDDTIFGGDGDDFLQGDSGSGVGDGNDFVAGEAGADIIFGEGGDDELDGGDGDDIQVTGNAGSDLVAGGAGNDLLVGDDGDGINGDADTIDGGDGDDIALGDGGDDFIAGGAGFDQLQGGDGADTLDGGTEDDVLFGEAGDDTLIGGDGGDQLIGGLGNDTLSGGDGNDVYFYFSGDAQDRISDTSGVDFLVFNNFVVGQLRLGIGSLKIALPDGGEVHLDDFDPDNPLSGPIEFFQFADGLVLSHQQLVQTLGFSVQGTPGDDVLSGSALGESIPAFGGNDVVMGRGGNDALDLGAGDDYASGGDGNDVILGGDGADLLEGGAGVDQVVGGLGDDRLGGGPGNDQPLDGGAGNDTYLFGTGDGQDVAIDSQGVNGVQLLGGLSADEVTLQRSGNDLVILVNGTSDRFTARDWFSNPAAWNQLGLGDGTVLDRAGVQARLVQNQAPILAPDTASTFEDNLVAVTGNALDNDVDPEGRALVVTNPGSPLGTYGSLTLQSNGAFSYAVDNGWLEGVQALAQGETASDVFTYTVSDNDPAGAASASSTITINIAGTNDAPFAGAVFEFVAEDWFTQTSGSVSVSDIDHGAVMHVVSPGTRDGAYGTLVLGVDGSYTYTLRNDSSAVQSLGQFTAVTDSFTYSVSDGIAQSNTAQLQVTISGDNDAPLLAVPLADQTAVAGRSFSYSVPQGSFTDIDVGDVLTYSASLVDGFELPAWLTFDASTQIFSGTAPSDASGFIDVEVSVTDGRTGGGGGGGQFAGSEAGFGEERGLSTASDVFRITFVAHGGGGGGGGGGQGNEGVGNGEDPPPPGHDENFNDGPGTSPGNPGAQGGNGLGHQRHDAPTLRSIQLTERRHVKSAAAERSIGAHNGNANGHEHQEERQLEEFSSFVEDALPADPGAAPLAPLAPLDVPPADSPAPQTDAAVETQLAEDPQYDFASLLDWLAHGGTVDEWLDPAEIARRWGRIARYVAQDAYVSDEARAAALGWQRFADSFAAANTGPASLGQFVGLGVASGLAGLERFRGLEEGLARL